jgi:hypothetical protein
MNPSTAIDLPDVRKSVYFRAATFSLLAPVICVLGGLVTAWFPGFPLVRNIIGVLLALIFLCGVIGGIVGLCGIRKYGKKELLWRSLGGLAIPVLMIVGSLLQLVFVWTMIAIGAP